MFTLWGPTLMAYCEALFIERLKHVLAGQRMRGAFPQFTDEDLADGQVTRLPPELVVRIYYCGYNEALRAVGLSFGLKPSDWILGDRIGRNDDTHQA